MKRMKTRLVVHWLDEQFVKELNAALAEIGGEVSIQYQMAGEIQVEGMVVHSALLSWVEGDE